MLVHRRVILTRASLFRSNNSAIPHLSPPRSVYVPSLSVFPPYVCPLHVHVSSMRMSPSVCVPSICMSPPCSCLFHGYVPPVCMSPLCAVASVCMFLCVVVPSYVCYPCVYVPGCACCFRVYIGPPCVDPLCVFVPPRVSSIV